MSVKPTIKNRLREFRFDHGRMTQEELAAALGVSRQTILAIEHGKFNPSVSLALRMARLFSTRVEEIFQIQEDAQ